MNSNLIIEIRKKRDAIIRIAEKHGAFNLRIFGSTVRGDQHTDSDLDLLIDVGPKHSPWFPAGLALELEELLGCKVDVVIARSVNPRLKARIFDEAVPL
ncbi:MAG: DNA polymerase subunit beta [Ectothiorhodospiraceae bacterium]|nr:DNA polymerase subunit beta [Ectothiorhodospiraceae bacterium]